MKGSTYKAPSLAAFEKFSTMYGITAGDDRQTRPARTLPCASGFKSLSRLFGLRRRHWLMAHNRPKQSWIFAILRLETGSTSIKISEGKTTAGDLKKMQRQRQAWMLKYMRMAGRNSTAPLGAAISASSVVPDGANRVDATCLYSHLPL